MTTYSLTIEELFKRPIIRNDQMVEFLNKMTDDEIDQWDKEVGLILEEEKVPDVFPDWNNAYLSKIIDRDILYNLFEMSEIEKNKQKSSCN
jgi:hypothetical protein